MTKEEAINYIENFGWSTTRLGLERTRELLEKIGDPHKKLKFIHVAGSNGKGSTCAMFDAILREAGYKTGLYISPYIQDFCERMQVNGKNIDGDDLARITGLVKDAAERMEDHPSQFELVTAIAMQYFYEQQCDIVVLEVGMGGALDSTNVIDAPELACITNIGLEHTEYLGSTLEEIAKTKAGIVKPGCSCVCYDGAPEVTKVVKNTCEKLNVPLSCVNFSRLKKLETLDKKYDKLNGQWFTWRNTDSVAEYNLSLLGTHQLHNAALVLTGIEMLKKKGWIIPDAAIREGLKNVKWPARFEVLSREPIAILDGGHNPQCAKALTESLKEIFPGKKVIFLAGVLRDKDYGEITDMLMPFANEFVCVTPVSPRALTGDELCEYLRNKGAKACACETIEDGILTVLNKTVNGSDCKTLYYYKSKNEQRIIEDEKQHDNNINKAKLLDKEGKTANAQISKEVYYSAIRTATLENNDIEKYMKINTDQKCEQEEIDENIIVIFGSLYLAGEARTLFHKTYRKWLRKTKIAARDGIPPEARKSLSERIVEHILESEEYKSSEKILIYEAVKGEVNLESLKRKALSDGKQLIYPKCVSKEEMVALCPLFNFDLPKDDILTSDNMAKDAESATMERPSEKQHDAYEQDRIFPFYNYSDCFEKGYCGIPEPIESKCALVKPEEIDLVICPCTSFDENCNRMGMGGGFYDRYLIKCKNAKICAVAFEAQKSKALPTDPWDKPMEAVFTEWCTYRITD